MKRIDFEPLFVEYRENLHHEIARFNGFVRVLRLIEDRQHDHLNEINLAPAFFQVTKSALYSSIILWGDKLLDEKGDRGLFNFLTFVEHNRKWLSPAELKRRREYPDGHWMLEGRKAITVKSIEEDRKRLRSLPALTSLRHRRDKFYAHFDKQYFFSRDKLDEEAPLSWPQLDEAVEAMSKVLNAYSTDYDGKIYTRDPINIEDLNTLLKSAKRLRAGK